MVVGWSYQTSLALATRRVPSSLPNSEKIKLPATLLLLRSGLPSPSLISVRSPTCNSVGSLKSALVNRDDKTSPPPKVLGGLLFFLLLSPPFSHQPPSSSRSLCNSSSSSLVGEVLTTAPLHTLLLFVSRKLSPHSAQFSYQLSIRIRFSKLELFQARISVLGARKSLSLEIKGIWYEGTQTIPIY
jgi:hypothetical protein